VKKTLTFKAVTGCGCSEGIIIIKLLILLSNIWTKGYDNQVYKSGLSVHPYYPDQTEELHTSASHENTRLLAGMLPRYSEKEVRLFLNSVIMKFGWQTKQCRSTLLGIISFTLGQVLEL